MNLASMLALLNDNTAGDISAADMRDIVDGLFRVEDPGLSYGEDSDDIGWIGDDVADGTEVTVTGAQTIVEGNGLLSVKYNSQSGGDVGALLFPKTIVTGDKWRVPVRQLADLENYSLVGLIMSDGTSAGANAAMAYLYSDNGTQNAILGGAAGTLTSIPGGGSGGGELNDFRLARLPWWFIELEYSAANTFIARWGDGIQFINWGLANIGHSFTPTHVGICWSKIGGSVETLATFGPLTKH